MRINADFDEVVVIRPADRQWVPSPAGGVERCMLDRIGGEVARATSLVRFAPNATFDAHTHGGGEEYLVIDGVFSDETGDFPTGRYVRNPIGTSHTPSMGGEGCTIFVKLHQFTADDDLQLSVDLADAQFADAPGEGVSIAPLHNHGQEKVMLIKFQPGGVAKPHDHPGGEEVLVLDGTFEDENGSYPKGTWMRSPVGSHHAPFSTQGCLIYVKHGHLNEIVEPKA